MEMNPGKDVVTIKEETFGDDETNPLPTDGVNENSWTRAIQEKINGKTQ